LRPESRSRHSARQYIDAVRRSPQGLRRPFLVHSPIRRALRCLNRHSQSSPSRLRHYRADLHVSVFVFETETTSPQQCGRFGSTTIRQAHTGFGRSPVAPITTTTACHRPTDTGSGQGAVRNLAAISIRAADAAPGTLPSCNAPINTAGPRVLDAAFHWLNRWVATGAPPPPGPLLAVAQRSPLVFLRASGGNVGGECVTTE